jgi:hypothetical protein
MEERLSFSITEFSERYSVSTQTILRLIEQKHVQTFTQNGAVRIWDPFYDRATGTNSAEDLYILRGCEVADILGVTTRNLRYLATGGQISHVVIGGQRRYSLADVRRLIAHRMEKKKTGKRGPRIRTALVKWALQRLTEMDRIKPYKSAHEGSDKSSWQDREFMSRKEKSQRSQR